MSERDWEKELRKIDEQMERASKNPVPPTNAATPATPAAPARAGNAFGGFLPKVGAGAAPPATSAFGVYARLTLATALAVGIAFWPYGARCGIGLAAYLAAVAAVVVAGGWSALWTWRHRAARAHLLSLLLVTWGVLLAATDVLPRVGYAIPTVAHPAAWGCS